MKTSEELLFEVQRLRVLGHKHRQISEDAEAETRHVRQEVQKIEKELEKVTSILREAITQGDRPGMETALSDYTRLVAKLRLV